MAGTRVRKASSKSRLKSNTSFFEKVYAVARKIPYGRVTSYGAIAKFLGAARSARMVGWAMNNSFHANPPVPAHRVLNRNGMLTGKHHFGSPTMMQQLLENEGIRVEDDCVVDWEKVFWEPKRGKRLKR
jgi:methylated-DNA-protein-cysteine methyltransferase related protein